MGKTLFVATANEGKLREIRAILSDTKVLGICDLKEPIEILEDGDTFSANAYKKAHTLMQILGVPVLADDSGLTVDALSGQPGVYSARYAGEHATDEENTKKLLSALSDVPKSQRGASFICVMCLVMPDGTTYYAEGKTRGEILFDKRGENGFGYDPVFYCEDYQKSFAELSSEEKNAISHRRKALDQMQEIFACVL